MFVRFGCVERCMWVLRPCIVKQMACIGKAPKGKIPHTWHFWNIKIPKPPNKSSLKSIGLLHFLIFLGLSEKNTCDSLFGSPCNMSTEQWAVPARTGGWTLQYKDHKGLGRRKLIGNPHNFLQTSSPSWRVSPQRQRPGWINSTARHIQLEALLQSEKQITPEKLISSLYIQNLELRMNAMFYKVFIVSPRAIVITTVALQTENMRKLSLNFSTTHFLPRHKH